MTPSATTLFRLLMFTTGRYNTQESLASLWYSLHLNKQSPVTAWAAHFPAQLPVAPVVPVV